MLSVVAAHTIAKPAIPACAAVVLDPRMLIRRNGLRSQLPADPLRLLREHNPLLAIDLDQSPGP